MLLESRNMALCLLTVCVGQIELYTHLPTFSILTKVRHFTPCTTQPCIICRCPVCTRTHAAQSELPPRHVVQ